MLPGYPGTHRQLSRLAPEPQGSVHPLSAVGGTTVAGNLVRLVFKVKLVVIGQLPDETMHNTVQHHANS